MEAQKIQPVFQGENCCLRIEFEVEVAHPTLNVLQKKLKFPLCPGDDVEIVHVSSVIAASPVFLDVMVELVKEHQGEQLAGLIPKGQAVGLVNVDAHEVIGTPYLRLRFCIKARSFAFRMSWSMEAKKW